MPFGCRSSVICPVFFTHELPALKRRRGCWGGECPPQYCAAQRERMMKLHDVLLKAMAKKITWWEAAEIIGVSDRTMRRWRQRLGEGGDWGLMGPRQRKGQHASCGAEDGRGGAAVISGGIQ